MEGGDVTRVKMADIANDKADALWRDTFWYTLNEIPKCHCGPRKNMKSFFASKNILLPTPSISSFPA